VEIRAYCPEDKPGIERLHRAQGFGFPMPDLTDPLHFIKLVGEENGRIVNAALAHLTAEIYFFTDPNHGTPRQRFDNFLTMERHGCGQAYYPGGLSDIHAFLPPAVQKAFGRRLLQLGWQREPWTPFVKFLKG
jgi:hypothetical protein